MLSSWKDRYSILTIVFVFIWKISKQFGKFDKMCHKLYHYGIDFCCLFVILKVKELET